MPQPIAATDRQALDTLYQGVVGASLKQAGIVDKDLPMNTATAFDDHADYVKTVESVLKDDKSNAFEPNDPILD